MDYSTTEPILALFVICNCVNSLVQSRQYWRLACLASFMKNLGFVSEKKGLCGALNSVLFFIIPAAFVPLLDCTWPENVGRMLTAY